MQRLEAFITTQKASDERFAKSSSENMYVGSEYCLACHTAYNSWRMTNHARSLRAPMVENSMVEGVGVIADYDQNGVDDFVQGLNFNDISSPYDPYKPNAPILSVKDGVYTISIGDVDMPVVFVSGGTQKWRERYQVSPMCQDEGGMPNTCADSCHNTRVNMWNYGLDSSELTWNEPFDVTNATKLKEYFGPAGKWWDTSEE